MIRNSPMMHEHKLTSFNVGAVAPVQNVPCNPDLENLRNEQTREELQVGKEETEARETQLLDIPSDILICIHDRLPLVDYMSFRAVSKLCRKVAPALDIRTAICRSEVQSNSLAPWLMYDCGNGRIRFSHPQTVDRFFVKIPKALQGAINWYGKDGWLLFGNQRGGDFFVSFFNPFTNDVRSYEKFIKRPRTFTSIGFSSPPTSHKCVVVVLETSPDFIDVHICYSREKGWRLFQIYNGNIWIKYTYPVFANGAFYFLSNHWEVGVLTVQGERCNWEVIEQEPIYHYSKVERFIAERDGEVFQVFRYDMRKRVRFLKLEPSTGTWKSLDNLGNYSLHVSRLNAFFTLVKNPLSENKIYFPRFCGKGLITYSPSKDSSQSFETTENSYKDATLGSFHWIRPMWS